VQKLNSSRPSKCPSILHAPPNLPSKPTFLEALQIHSFRGSHHFLYFFLYTAPRLPRGRPAGAHDAVEAQAGAAAGDVEGDEDGV
jgi:hypothetical protein